MRRHAEDAHQGVWRMTSGGDVLLGDWNIIVGDRADARHIASWRPAVARAVADLMDHAAAQLEREIARLHAFGLEPFEFLAELYEPSLAVARAFLAEASDAS